MNATIASRRLGPRALGLAIALVVAGFCAASVIMLYDARQETWRRTTTGQTNLVRALAQNIARNIEIYDLSLQAVIDGLLEQQLSSLSPRMQDLVLFDRSVSAVDLGSILVLDRDGKVVRDSKGLSTGSDYSAYDVFTAQRRDAHLGLYISAPFKPDGNGGETVIGLSRRLRSPDGAFVGVVVGTLQLSFFSSLFATVDIGQRGAITLLRLDGTSIMHRPYSERLIGYDYSKTSNFRRFMDTGTSVFMGTAFNDNVRRIYDIEFVGNLPLVLNVALAEEDVFAAWRTRAVILAAALLSLCAAAAMLWYAFGRQLRRTAEAERAANRSEAQYRLLADHAQDIIMRLDRSLRRTYVSPAVTAVAGYAPEELLGFTPQGIVHPDDWPSLRDLIAEAQREGRNVEAVYRLRHKAGYDVWVEGRYSSVAQDGGFIIVLREISKRKVAEEALAALNAKLALYAGSDALTGLANRRRFDEVLETEWRQATRDGTALSLILFDADRFKLYNDTFGHPEGDACLRIVADVLKRVVSPADLAVRYGGEEFAVILPRRDAAAAAAVAEQIRAAVVGLARPHPGNTTAGGIVTVSLGCATARPAEGTTADGPAGLVAIADACLYAAKRGGRNRVACPGIAEPGLSTVSGDTEVGAGEQRRAPV